MPKTLYRPLFRYKHKGVAYKQENWRGAVDSNSIFSRRWVFIWITKNLTLDTYTVRSRLVNKSASWRKRFGALIGGVSGIYDTYSVLPPGVQAFMGVIYFNKTTRGSFARKYLHFLLQLIGWGGEIFSMEPDRPTTMGSHGPFWRDAGISHIAEGPAAPKGQKVNPFWDVRFGVDLENPGSRPNLWY